jgi:hypothetical protein
VRRLEVSSAVADVVLSKSDRQHPHDFTDSSVSYALVTLQKRTLQIVYVSENTVAYLLKSSIIEPEIQPLLANGSETFVSRQTPRNEQQNNARSRQQTLNNATVGL